jgi:hypothetical protein
MVVERLKWDVVERKLAAPPKIDHKAEEPRTQM